MRLFFVSDDAECGQGYFSNRVLKKRVHQKGVLVFIFIFDTSEAFAFKVFIVVLHALSIYSLKKHFTKIILIRNKKIQYAVFYGFVKRCFFK